MPKVGARDDQIALFFRLLDRAAFEISPRDGGGRSELELN
jgi:hypothetical protein